MLHKLVVLACLIVTGGVICMADEFLHPRPMPKVLFPINGASVAAGPFTLLALAAQNDDGSFESIPLQVDGKDQSWQPYAPPVCLAPLDLPPGEHFVRLGGCEVMFYVTAPDTAPPTDWIPAKAHPGKDAWRNCALCHETTQENGLTVLGPHKGCEVCAPCHAAGDMAAKHNHSEPPLRDCALCHAVHGATLESLLRAPKKQLCAHCHREGR